METFLVTRHHYTEPGEKLHGPKNGKTDQQIVGKADQVGDQQAGAELVGHAKDQQLYEMEDQVGQQDGEYLGHQAVLFKGFAKLLQTYHQQHKEQSVQTKGGRLGGVVDQANQERDDQVGITLPGPNKIDQQGNVNLGDHSEQLKSGHDQHLDIDEDNAQ